MFFLAVIIGFFSVSESSIVFAKPCLGFVVDVVAELSLIFRYRYWMHRGKLGMEY